MGDLLSLVLSPPFKWVGGSDQERVSSADWNFPYVDCPTISTEGEEGVAGPFVSCSKCCPQPNFINDKGHILC